MVQKRREQDAVTGLLTGKMVKRKDSEGRIITVFQPFKQNPHDTLENLIKTKGKHLSEDVILSQERLRQPALEIDRAIFIKTELEKEELKLAKLRFKTQSI